MAFLFRSASLRNRIFGNPGLSDLIIGIYMYIYIYIYVEGSLTQEIEGYSGFGEATNYLRMTTAAMLKGEFLNQYQIHQLFWVYLNEGRTAAPILLSGNVSFHLIYNV